MFFSIFQISALGVFLSLVIGKTVYLKKKFKINALKLKLRGKDGIKHLIEFLSFIIVSIWTFVVLFYSLNSAFGTFPNIKTFILFDIFFIKIFGILLVIIAFTIFIWALKDLGLSWRLGIDETDPGVLITKGIYSFIRHPIYLFFDLYFIGTFLINPNLVFLIFTLVIITMMHYQVLAEENFLKERFADEYTKYMKNVGRYLSFTKIKGLFLQKKYSDKSLIEEKQ